jgi:hypothetical protein
MQINACPAGRLRGMTLSLILGIVGITGQVIASRNPRAGWTISLANQPLWVLFAIVTHQYGLLLMNAGYATAAVLNLRRARRDQRTRQQSPVLAPATKLPTP